MLGGRYRVLLFRCEVERSWGLLVMVVVCPPFVVALAYGVIWPRRQGPFSPVGGMWAHVDCTSVCWRHVAAVLGHAVTMSRGQGPLCFAL